MKVFKDLFNIKRWRYIFDEIAYRVKKDYYAPRDIVWIIQSFLLRGARGWSDTDYWNANEHIALVTMNVLKDLRNNLHGHSEDVSEEEWKEHLDLMIKAWQIMHYIAKNPSLDVTYTQQQQLDVGLYLFETRFRSLWD